MGSVTYVFLTLQQIHCPLALTSISMVFIKVDFPCDSQIPLNILNVLCYTSKKTKSINSRIAFSKISQCFSWKNRQTIILVESEGMSILLYETFLAPRRSKMKLLPINFLSCHVVKQ